MLYIGHRGLMDKYPANSLEAFSACFFEEKSVHGIECDIRSSGEGTQVIFHDTWLHGKRVSDTPLTALRSEGIPTLQDLLDLGKASDKLLDIELKGDANPWEVAQLLKQYHGFYLDEQLLISSFHLSQLQYFHAEMPHIRIGLIRGLFRFPMKWGKPKYLKQSPERRVRSTALRKLETLFPDAQGTLIPHIQTVSLELVAEAKRLNTPLLSWGVQSQREKELAHLFDLHGVIVDDI